LLALLAAAACAGGQSTAPQPPAQAPAYTLHAKARVVLTDVVVQDRNGNPVTGLKASSFRILDENKPQQIVSFEEHRFTPAKTVAQPVAAARGVYSNSFLADPSTSLDILLVDLTTIGFGDQHYLRDELFSFLNHLDPGQYVALYVKAGERTVPVVGFTNDRGRVKEVIARLMPRLPTLGVDRTPVDWVLTLDQIAGFLTNVPGRKNIFWFAGPANPFQTPDMPDATLPNLQPLYDELEVNRMAIFPVDARGLTVMASPADSMQHLDMDGIAEATGGKAYYNANDLGDFTSRASRSNACFYTLTYTPRDVKMDNRWHHVKVMVEGDDGQRYQLQYRRGYFDDGGFAGRPDPPPTVAESKAPPRIRLMEDGSTRTLTASRSVPIVFTATVLPTSDPALDPTLKPVTQIAAIDTRKLTPLTVQYEIPPSGLVIQPATETGDGRDHVEIAVSLIAYNERGRAVGKYVRHISLLFKPEYLIDHPSEPFRFQELIGLPHGQTSVVLAVEDLASERTGTLQLSLKIPAGKHEPGGTPPR
jgi:VWFA-related protein